MVDIAGYGGMDRTRPNYVALRAGMYASIQRAFAKAGIPWAKCFHQDEGDGILVLAPADVPKGAFAGIMPKALVAALREHNEAHPPEERIKMRLALEAGEVTFDDLGGAAASAIIRGSRLLDAPRLKDALKDSPGVLAMIVSDWFYTEVIRHRAEHAPDEYRKVAVDVKETSTVGWIRLPGHVLPPEPPAEERGDTEVSVRAADSVTNGVPVLAPVRLRSATPEFYQVVDALEEISCMRDERERAQVVDQLSFAGTIRYFPSRRAHLTSILRTCLDFDNGVVDLATVISGQEPSGSQPLERFLRLLFGGSL